MPDLRRALEEAKARVGRVNALERMLVRQAREASGASQSTFAARVGTPLAALRDWEQGSERGRAQYCACCAWLSSIMN